MHVHSKMMDDENLLDISFAPFRCTVGAIGCKRGDRKKIKVLDRFQVPNEKTQQCWTVVCQLLFCMYQEKHMVIFQ